MRCLVIQTAFLGDVILTVPLLRLLNDLERVRGTAVVAAPAGAALLRGQGIVDQVIEYDKRGRDRGLLGLRRAASAARRFGADAALVPHRSFGSALLALQSGAGTRVGFAVSGGRVLLTRALPYPAGVHEAERVARLIEGVGGAVPEGPLPLTLTVPAGGQEELDQALAASGVEPGQGIVVLAPGSAWPTKRWPAGRFAETADALGEALGTTPVLSGDREDAPAAREVVRLSGRGVVDLAGRLTLGGWIALIARARLLVSNDSAAAHLASAVGTPVVAVFGPTVPAQGFAPYGERAAVVEAPLDCRPCGRHGGGRCPLGTHACMLDVPASAVIREATRLAGGATP